MEKIYISSGAIKSKNINQLLNIAQENNIKNIEMSAGLNFYENIEDVLYKKANHFNFLIHNYFPPQSESFMLNLGSNNKEIIKKSIDLCKHAITLSSSLGCEFYSVHCGFTFDSNGSHLGKSSQLKLNRITIEEALIIFVKNIKYLAEYAKSKGVKLAIENNVLSSFGLINGQNELCLGATSQDLKKIFGLVNHDNLYLLLDLGHAKVNVNTLGDSIEEIIKEFDHKIICVHISDNDGFTDYNKKLTFESDLIKYIRLLKDRYLVLEVYNLEPEEIKEQINLLKEVIL